MDSISVYLAGGMSNVKYDERLRWRSQVRDTILYGGYDYVVKPLFFSPPEYYDFETIYHNSEREVMEFDLNRLRNSGLVIVNFNDPESLGTMAELAIAYEHRIPVLGLNADNNELHPWVKEFCNKMFVDMKKLCNHVVTHFLN